MTFLAALGDVIAPPRCLNCLQENTWLCRACAARLPVHNYRSKALNPLAGLISAGPYRHPAYKRLVSWLKFKGVRSLAPLAAAAIADSLQAIAPLPTLQQQAILVPIPLHRARARQRGFNQTLEIAQSLSEQTYIPLAELLTRPKSSWTQSQLPHHLRSQNVSNAFQLADPPSWGVPSISDFRYILLIDDVSTTGSTLLAAAQALAPHTAAHLWGCVVAQG